MTRLRDLAPAIRSKNAGPFWVTFDVLFRDASTFEAVRRSGALSKQLFADMFHLDASRVALVWYEQAYALKVAIPREISAGSPGDGDLYGCQWFAPLVDVEVPVAMPVGR